MKKIILLLLVMGSSWALYAKNSSEKTAVLSPNAPAPIGAYSQAIKTGTTTYISGQIPMDPKTGDLAKGDFKAHFEQTISNLTEIAKAAGGDLDRIVKVTIYVADLTNYSVINTVMAEHFHKPYPARVVVEIKDLPKHADVEIEAIMQN